MKLLKLFSRTAMLACLMSVLGSCADDLRPEPVGPTTDGTELPVEIRLNIPKSSDARALSPDDEKVIKDLRVLVFKVSGGNETFEYEAPVQSHTNKQAIVLLKTGADLYKAVLIANNGEPFSTTFTQGNSKEEVLKTITFDSNDKWNTTSSTDYKPLPMWGESEAVTITGAALATPFSAPVNLTRSVSRIDVGLALSGDQFNETSNVASPDLNGFTLESVSVYNSNNKGYVAPIKNDLTKPYVPVGAVANNKLSYTVDNNLTLREIYVSEAINEAGTEYMKRPFLVIGGQYKGTTSYYRIDFLKKESDGKFTYLQLLRNYRYKVNITKIGGKGFDTEDEAAAATAANISYDVTVWNESAITNVVYDGQYMLGVSEDNLTYYNHAHTKDITVRTDWPAGWDATVIEGGDWLSIAPGHGDKDKDVKMGISVKENKAPDAQDRTGKVKITAGRMQWIVNVKQLTEGEISLQICEEDGVTPISMLSFNNKGGTKKIVVNYSPSSPAEGTFSGPDGQNLNDFKFKKIDAESAPGKAVYEVSINPMTDANNYFESLTDAATFKIMADGKTVADALVMQQTEYNAIPFSDAQLQELMLGEEPFYLMDGKPTKFFMKSNAAYTIKMIKNTPEIAEAATESLITQGFTLNTPINKKGNFSGEPMPFTPANDLADPKRFFGYAEFEVTSPDNLFEKKTFRILLASGIMQPEANCYLMKPNHIGIIIPVSQIDKAADFYNGFKPQLEAYYTGKSSLGTRTWDNDFKLPKLNKNRDWRVEVIWAEVKANYTDGAVVSSNPEKGMLRVLTKAGKDYIFVMPSYASANTGNIIIGLKQDGKILWSWHLWLVDKYPSENPLTNESSDNQMGVWEDEYPNGASGMKWLDRDLGAFGTTAEDKFKVKELVQYGLLYQWGRKDPFPLLKKGNGTSILADGANDRATQIIDANGQPWQGEFSLPAHTAEVGTMKEMINNPTIFYTTPSDENISPFLEMPDGNISGVPTVTANEAYAAFWGGIYQPESTDRKFCQISEPTKKTVFDPSPYGWKVPNSGNEANFGKYRPTISTVDGFGGFYKQDGSNSFPKLSNGDSESFRWTSTRMTNCMKGRYLFGTGKFAKPATNKAWSTSMGAMVRSVKNDKEADYDQYLPKIKIKR